ncbi:MAG: hypothetical protein WCA39_16985 [Nitrososphaeraceae archaeon]
MLYIKNVLFNRRKRFEWSLEYEDALYKIYDSAKRLAGYFFPDYGSIDQIKKEIANASNQGDELDEDSLIRVMNKKHVKVQGGSLMLPMLKLDLLDNQSGIAVNDVVDALDRNIRTAGMWKTWLSQNSNMLGIVDSLVYTAREDRNMLSILLVIKDQMILGEKEAVESLAPILNKLHGDGLL